MSVTSCWLCSIHPATQATVTKQKGGAATYLGQQCNLQHRYEVNLTQCSPPPQFASLFKMQIPVSLNLVKYHLLCSQRPSHIFIASLASTDLLLGLTVMVPRLVHELAGSWIFGFLLCQVNYAAKFGVRHFLFCCGLHSLPARIYVQGSTKRWAPGFVIPESLWPQVRAT